MAIQVPPELVEIIKDIVAYQDMLEKEKDLDFLEYAYIEEYDYSAPAEQKQEEEKTERGVIHIDI